MLYYPPRARPSFPIQRGRMIKKVIGGVVALVLIVLAVLFWPFRRTSDKPADIVTAPTPAKDTSHKPLAASTTPSMDVVVEEVLTICDFNQVILNVNADSGKHTVLGVPFVTAIDSAGEKFILPSSGPVVFIKGEKYKVTYHTLNDQLRIEDLHRNDNLGFHPVLTDRIEARGIIVSAVLVKE